MPSVFLPHRALFRIGGADAESFLQNLITTDIVSMAPNEARPGALLTPQGKILFDFMIWRDGTDFIIETDRDQHDALVKRLTMYKLRAAVTLSSIEADGVTVSWDDATAEGAADSRFA
ncbi:MAG TPA: folate-binding protein, partial [Afipia sp.]